MRIRWREFYGMIVASEHLGMRRRRNFETSPTHTTTHHRIGCSDGHDTMRRRERRLGESGQSSSNMLSTTFIARFHSRLIMGFIFSLSSPFWENHDLFIVEMSFT